jgi:hypothetical protein
MPPRSTPAATPAVEKSPTPAPAAEVVKSPNSLSRLERAALAHKNAVAERDQTRARVAEATRNLDAAHQAFNDAGDVVIETAKQLTAAALGKPE